MEPVKPGKTTSEFALTLGSMVFQYASAVLAAIAALNGMIPDKYAAWIGIAVIFATAIKAFGYSLSRGNVKAAEGAAVQATEIASDGVGDAPEVSVSA